MDFVIKRLTVSNVCMLLGMAEERLCTPIFEGCRAFLVHNFMLASNHADFASCISLNCLKSMLVLDDLYVEKEEYAVDATLRWVAHVPNRAVSLDELLPLVRWPTVDMLFLHHNVETNADLVQVCVDASVACRWSFGCRRRLDVCVCLCVRVCMYVRLKSIARMYMCVALYHSMQKCCPEHYQYQAAPCQDVNCITDSHDYCFFLLYLNYHTARPYSSGPSPLSTTPNRATSCAPSCSKRTSSDHPPPPSVPRSNPPAHDAATPSSPPLTLYGTAKARA